MDDESIPSTCVAAEPFVLQVTDDSMAPEFWSGCVVIIDPTGHAKDGAFVLAELDGKFIFRTLRGSSEAPWLEPLNKDFPLIPLQEGLAQVRGVVVQRAGRRRSQHKHYK
ncbi:MAG: S24 family peptidase [Chromatiales bacterium]|nr:S24 family peptidase [Chromatiales bacterium]